MTRDEAVAAVIKSKEQWGGGSSELWLVNALQALGMLNLDEPKGSNERAVDAMFSYPPCKSGLITPRHALEALDAAGLKIVEK